MIETKVDGSTGAVDGVTTWLRDTLRTAVDGAADDVIAAKRLADRSWLGQSGDAYVGYAKDIVSVTDEHVQRISTAARKVDSYSGRLGRMQRRMGEVRQEARDGGLTVSGTQIQTPPAAQAVAPLPADATPDEQQTYQSDMAAHRAATAKITLYNKLLGDVEDESTNFVDWVDTNLTPVVAELTAPKVDTMVTWLKENAGLLGISYALTHGERALERKVSRLNADAKELRDARRSGNPARRARGTAPDAPEKIRDLKTKARWFGKGGKLLGPLGAGLEIWSGLESDSPAGGVIAAGVGIGVAALVVATAPVSVPAAAVAIGAVAVGAGATWLANEGWDALPDSFTEPVDDWVGDRWDDTKGAVSDGWDTVKGWF